MKVFVQQPSIVKKWLKLFSSDYFDSSNDMSKIEICQKYMVS